MGGGCEVETCTSLISRCFGIRTARRPGRVVVTEAICFRTVFTRRIRGELLTGGGAAAEKQRREKGGGTA